VREAAARSFIPRHVLLTGGAGFIGSNLVHWLLCNDPGLSIVTLDALTYAGSLDNLADLPDPARHQFVHGDICDRALVERLLREHRIDSILHLAAESHVDRSIDGSDAFVRTNLAGTHALLEAARCVWGAGGFDPSRHRFCHISTDEVYGALKADEPPFAETNRYQPNSPYAATKAGSDHLVRAYHHTYGLPVVITHCSNNYGPRQHAEKFIPTVIRACLLGWPIPVYGDGSNVRDWLYVDDHCRGIDTALRRGRPGESYNFGGRCELANLALAEAICTLMDEVHPAGAPHQRLISFVADRLGHDWRYAINFAKAEANLGWHPQVPFADGLRRTVAWYVECVRRAKPPR
jgi:dTDP-glucose 4,6-dehydratase